MTADEILQKETDKKVAEEKERQEREDLICNRFKELRAKYPYCTKTKVAEAVATELKMSRQGIEGILYRNNAYENA